MTLEEKVGQMLLLGWQGDRPEESHRVNAHAQALIEDLAVGGVIVMGRNVAAPAQLRGVLDELQGRAAGRGLPPLFVATDQEGGRVSRLTPPHFTHMPSAWQIGQTGDPELARAAARAIAEELQSVGINWDFAPVLDVNNNPRNPVIGDRSYSDDPAVVAEMGVAAVRGFQDDAGLLACGKHFPGHGDTDVDSHLDLPHVPHPRARLESVEFAPFRAAIQAGLAAVMTTHIVFPALDPDLPATLSPHILTGLLRGDMGFDGLIITDCLEMKGVAARWGAVEAAVLAAVAGADILLCCHTWQTQRAIRDGLISAVQGGRLSERRIEKSLARITAAKARWLSRPPVAVRPGGFPEHQALAERIAAAAGGK